jgi:hypothetical protein
VSYFVAALFRVRLEFLKAKEVRPAVSGRFHMTLYTVARDAESAAASARGAMSAQEGFTLESVRVVSVEFVECVNVLASRSAAEADRYPQRPRGQRSRSRAAKVTDGASQGRCAACAASSP